MKMVNHKAQPHEADFVNFSLDGNDGVEDKKVFQRVKNIEPRYSSLVYVQHSSRTESPSHNVRILCSCANVSKK